MPRQQADDYEVCKLSGEEITLFRALLACFAAAFDEEETYLSAQPGDAYLSDLLNSRDFVALAAVHDGKVIGGLAAYVLRKFEQERSEIYIYDLAVDKQHRRRGIATRLILDLKALAAARGISIVFVQADGDDPPAIALYERFGKREEVLHFDV
ncbi:MAG: AAC(3)-I family aminoglycoside N-acetyltransferase [Kiloniellales bacterium]